MKQSNLKKTVGIATVALAVSAGAAAGVYAYQSGNDFNPDSKERELKANQVSFSDNTDIGKSNEDKKDNSALWEKDQKAQESERPDNGDEPSYLFENILPDNQGTKDVIGVQNEQDTVPEQNNPSNPNQSQNDQTTPDEIFDIVQNESDADVRIDIPSDATPDKPSSDNPSGDNGDKSNSDGDNDAETGSGAGGNGDKSDDKPSESESPSVPDKPSEPETPDTPSTPDTPTRPRPADTAKDPEVTKPKPGIVEITNGENYNENITGGNNSKREWMAVVTQSVDESAALYKGKSVDAYTVYCALDTYVMDADDRTKSYIWGADAYNKYIRVDALSFDGGQTWESNFPIMIPEDLSQNIEIKVSYRLKASDAWSEMNVTYAAKDSRIFLLSKALENENETIDPANILNWNQYLSIGSILDLYNYQTWYLTTDAQDKLFPGWTEDGKSVPWMYEVTGGRHILEPMDFVDLDEAYTVKGSYRWIKPDGSVDVDLTDMNAHYCLMQTLTNISDDAIETRSFTRTLEVPEYVQIVDMEEPLTVDTLEIPDTVIFVNTEKNLNVLDAYDIDADNSVYTSENGILYTKDETEIIGIPQRIDTVNISENVKKIVISENNQIHTLNIESTSLVTMPSIDFSKLSDCKVIVRDTVFDEFIDTYGELLTQEGSCIASDAHESQTFTVKNGMVISNDGELYKATGKSGSSIRLSDKVQTVDANAFAKAENITMLMMPEAHTVQFKEGALDNSNIQTILCYTRTQAESVSAQLKAQKITDITVDVMSKTSDGFMYYEKNYSIDDDTVSRVVLLDAPEGVAAFGGTIENNSIQVDEIGDRAFENCTMLQWVELPENVDRIGYQAFYGCEALEGIMIDTKDTITIGNQAFDACDRLRFVASNAKHAVMEDDYDPYITDWIITYSNYFFVPKGADGYGTNVNDLFDVTDDVSGGFLLDVLDDGYPMLYAVDKNGNPTVALRSGFDVPDEVVLPTTLNQIYVGAFAHASSPNKSYTLNWEDLNINTYQVGAFMDSWLSGDVVIHSSDLFGDKALLLYGSVFSYCPKMTSVKIEGTINYLGEYVFAYCDQLQSVSFGTFGRNLVYTASISSGLFDGCGQLQTLYFADYNAPLLTVYAGMPFQFNLDWSEEEEARKLRIIVPEGAEENYIKGWRYAWAGYTNSYYADAYLDMWYQLQNDLTDWNNYIFPEEAEVDAVLKSKLLVGENHLRMMLGADTVSEPVDFYPYRERLGMLTLIGAPSYLKETSLDPDIMGLPSGWCIDIIGEGAFSNCEVLSSVNVPDTIIGIYNNAFRNAATLSDTLTLRFMSETPLSLQGATKESPFVFGVDEEKIHIIVPEGLEATYIRSWVYSFCGYESLEEMQTDIRATLEASGAEVTQDEVDTAVGELLLQAENRLRKMMGLPQVDNVEDMYAVYKTETDENQSETEESEETEETDTKETEDILQIPETNVSETQIPETEESETKESETGISETTVFGSDTQETESIKTEYKETESADMKPGGTKE